MTKQTDLFLCGDALKMLQGIEANSIDIGVTSPPYNKQENKKGWLVKNVMYAGVSDKKDEVEYQKEQIDVLNELYRVIKPGGSFFYNHKVRWERGDLIHPISWIFKTRWILRQEIIWDRMIAANIRGWRFWQTDERIYWLFKPIDNKKIGTELKSSHALLTSVWRFPPERGNSHPAPFPLLLPLRCIFSILDDKKQKIVVDPYMGSGTTAIAAKLLGHNFVGIDISSEYIASAKKRLAQLHIYTDYLAREKEKHFVQKTFKERKEGDKGDKANAFKLKMMFN